MHGRSAQRLGERTCHAGGADVVGDVACELLGRQAQRAVLRRQRIARMVAQQDNACVGPASDNAIAVVVLGADAANPHCVMSHARKYSCG